MFREIGLYLVASPRSRYRQLQQLSELDAERLVDLGITSAEARRGKRAPTVSVQPRQVTTSAWHAEAGRAGA